MKEKDARAKKKDLPAVDLPDHRKFPNPFNNRALLKYFKKIFLWHGYIKFLGLPHLRDEPDVLIRKLYVEPFAARRRINPETPVKDWPEHTRILSTVADNPRMVLLGDPGSGKSTLVSWIAWELRSVWENHWTRTLGRLVPFPMVLRELKIDREITWDKLLDAFLEHAMAEPLRGKADLIRELMERGQAFILIDGLDEIGDIITRSRLHIAIYNGLKRYPRCRWLLTSRIVGYDAAPFHEIPRPTADVLSAGEPLGYAGVKEHPDWAEVRYISPFTDRQISEFAGNWYMARGKAEPEPKKMTKELLEAIMEHRDTHRLARIPQLLTMMSLIYRVRARLPRGRALLYDEIAQAYLESIDEFRGIRGMDYPLHQKKRWLGHVGFQMQLKRVAEKGKITDEILARKADVLEWIAEVIERRADENPREAAEKFIDYIGRRSGLLLPRGPDIYAFIHLSFQEYFAAWRLAEVVTSPEWLLKETGKFPEDAADEKLREYVDDVLWRETFVLLFEILADRPRWSDRLANILFFSKPLKANSAMLLAEIAVDPHSGLSNKKRETAWKSCWEWDLTESDPRLRRPKCAPILLAADADFLQDIWTAFKEVTSKLPLKELNLSYCNRIVDLSPLSGLSSLKELYLDACTGVTDLTPLTGLENLQELNLGDCTGVTNLTPLAGLENLDWLDLTNCTGVTDLAPLVELENLEFLDLRGCTGVMDLAPLAGLENLQELNLGGCTGVTDLTPLAGLENLESLDLSGCTGVTDLSPLSGLKKLQVLE